MRKIRAAALVLALCLLLVPLGGCSRGEDTAAIATSKNGEIPAGVYLYYLTAAYDDAAAAVENPYGNVLEQTVDGVPAAEWIARNARNETMASAAASAKFEELGLSLDAQTTARIASTVSSMWSSYGARLESFGIAQSSLEQVIASSYKSRALLHALYGEGGEFEIPEAQLRDYYEETYRRVIPLVMSNTLLEGEGLELQKQRFADYYERALAGEELLDLIIEENAFQTGVEPEEAAAQFAGSTQEVVVTRDTTGYPQDLLDQIFATQEKNAVQKYEGEDYDILFEVRELAGDDFSFEGAHDTILEAAAAEDYRAYLEAAAQEIGYALNEKAVARYTVEEMLNR